MGGFVYIMSNPSYDGRIKIGKSSKDPSQGRIEELSSSTSAPEKFSEEGCLIKLADKCSNIAAIAHSPPIHWNAERKRYYVAWARSVIDGLPHKPEVAVQAFEIRCKATLSQIARET